jgi:hypothetical protein
MSPLLPALMRDAVLSWALSDGTPQEACDRA